MTAKRKVIAAVALCEPPWLGAAAVGGPPAFCAMRWAWAALLALIVSYAPAPSQRMPLAAAPTALTLSPVTLDGWDFNLVQFEGGRLYVQQPLDEDAARQMLASIRFADRVVPTTLNVGELDLMDYFVLGSRAAYERSGRELAGAPQSEVPIASIGYSFLGGKHPGTYYDPALLKGNDGLLTWAVAHEVAHQAEHALSRRRPYPQWFDEGVADFVASQVVHEVAPDYLARREYVAEATLGAAARQGNCRT
ncbi:MAG: hypothetical protein QOF51_2735 [Chloroflexota bacterium]|nr:hypothetical protein [Chloroflexota bacterium]